MIDLSRLHLPAGIERLRPLQERGIIDAVEAFRDGNKFVVAQWPVGGGKSVLAESISQAMGTNLLYVVTTKAHERQILDTFPDAFRLNGKANWTTANYPERWPDVNCSQCTYNAKSRRGCDLCQDPRDEDNIFTAPARCPYRRAIRQVRKERFVVTNVHYLIGSLHNPFSPLNNRGLVVIDEAHELEKTFMNTFSVKFSAQLLDTIGVFPPEKGTHRAKWLRDSVLPAIDQILLFEQEDMDDREMSKWNMLKDQINFILVNFEHGWAWNPIDNEQGIEFLPVHVNTYLTHIWQRYDRFLLMSGSILDPRTFTESLGIEKDEYKYLQAASPFETRRNPIRLWTCGSMSRDNKEATFPRLVRRIGEICAKHGDENGLLHTQSYRLGEELVDALRGKIEHHILHYTEDMEKEEILRRLMLPGRPKLLAGPGLETGFDLKNDLCRFNILAKMPFPYLGNLQISKRMNSGSAGRRWYALQTAMAIVQAFGRGMRHELDFCMGYILDSEWLRFFKDYARLFPPEFRASLTKSPGDLLLEYRKEWRKAA